MNRRIQSIVGPWFLRLGQLAVGITAVTLIIQSAGCASGRPAPLLIERPVAVTPVRNCDQGLNLKLVTYNIWGLPSWMTGARSGRYPQIARELRRLSPDVILLQEAWTADARKSAPVGGKWAVARAAGQHTFFQQSGLVTLSCFPILGGEFYPFSHAAYPDRWVNKGVLKVTVQLAKGQVLNVWNVHLQDGGPPAIQLTQVHELIARVCGAEDGQVADLVAGDFNCTPGSPLYRELSNAFGPSMQELSGSAPFVTWDGLSGRPRSGETLDHIFVRRRTPFRTVEANPHVAFAAARREDRLSDHFGIEADLKLGAGPSLAGASGLGLHRSSVSSVVSAHGPYAAGD